MPASEGSSCKPKCSHESDRTQVRRAVGLPKSLQLLFVGKLGRELDLSMVTHGASVGRLRGWAKRKLDVV